MTLIKKKPMEKFWEEMVFWNHGFRIHIF